MLEVEVGPGEAQDLRRAQTHESERVGGLEPVASDRRKDGPSTLRREGIDVRARDSAQGHELRHVSPDVASNLRLAERPPEHDLRIADRLGGCGLLGLGADSVRHHLIAARLDVLGCQPAERDGGDGLKVEQHVLIAAKRIPADRGPGALIEPPSAVFAKAQPREVQSCSAVCLQLFELSACFGLRPGRAGLV
ncbi:MAG: hypothetical protein ACR2GO_00095 [Candidatus Limnocylindria bacterium]